MQRWNATYFGNRLSRDAVAALDPLNDASADVQALADRAFRLMLVARLDAADLPVFTARLIASGSKAPHRRGEIIGSGTQIRLLHVLAFHAHQDQ